MRPHAKPSQSGITTPLLRKPLLLQPVEETQDAPQSPSAALAEHVLIEGRQLVSSLLGPEYKPISQEPVRPHLPKWPSESSGTLVDSLDVDESCGNSGTTKPGSCITSKALWTRNRRLKLRGGSSIWTACVILSTLIIAFIALAVFAINATLANADPRLLLPNSEAVTVIALMSNGIALLMSMFFSAAVETFRWRLAVDGVLLTTFLGLSPATGAFGKLALLFSRHVSWSSRAWILQAFVLWAAHYVLSFILTYQLQSVPQFDPYNIDAYMALGMGPFCPYDLTGIVFSGPSLGDRIALKYDGFTQNAAEMYPLTSNLTWHTPLDPSLPLATIGPICSAGCFASLMPGTANLAMGWGTKTPESPPFTDLCDAEHVASCLVPPYLMEASDWALLSDCTPANRSCVGDAVLEAQESWNRTLSFKVNTNFTTWQYSTANTFVMTHAPAYIVYFAPLPEPGPQQASSMGLCQNYSSNGYAINACIMGMGTSAFAVGWSVCEPFISRCNASDAGWMSTLPWSTVMTIERHTADTYQTWPQGGIKYVSSLSPPQPLEIPANQFFNVFTSAFQNGPALESLVYDVAISTELTAGTGDISQMRDVLSYALYASSTQLFVEQYLGYVGDGWQNIGQGGFAYEEQRILVSVTALVIYVILAALTLLWCLLLLYFAQRRHIPNGTSFPEFDMATRTRDLTLFEGLSNATNGDVVKKIAGREIFVGESDDGQSVEISRSRRPPLRAGVSYL